MISAKKSAKFLKKIPWITIGIVCLFVLLGLLVAKSSRNNNQALMATGANIYFEGEYSINGGSWNKIEEGQHIPATKGDVTLRGRFHLASPSGEYLKPAGKGTPISFFLDHVNIKVYESGKNPYELFNEHPAVGSSGCGEIWLAYVLTGETEDPIEIVIHNPHSFGNDTAVDEFLAGIDFWTGNDFEGIVLERGESQRYLGLLFSIGAIVLLGIALFSMLIRVPKNILIWLFGFVTFFAGAYLTYSADGTYFWSELIAVNTSIIGVSMMYYMLFVSAIIAFFSVKTKKIGRIATAVLGIVDSAFILLPFVSNVYFYDILFAWVIAQSILDLILLACLIREIVSSKWKMRLIYFGMMMPLLAFEIDVIATVLGYWKGGVVSAHVFVVIFISVLAFVLFVIPQNILALRKAKELELQRSRLELEKNAIAAELKESRMSIMLSQIRPHFIYNTLGTIERLCLKDPQMAFELVRNFSMYLRGNFSELDSVAPIRFSEEMKHVQYYVNIEQVRFPDMTIEYQLDSSEFALPAITVQPLVENAIKHGLMPLETGGKVLVRSYETDTHFYVEVVDNGAGFDTNALIDKKQHIGLNNIRERLKAIVNGDLVVESTLGEGTKATIMIPKEDTI